MLGVLIGVASVIALVAVGNGARASVTNTLNSLGSNTLTVVPGTTAASPFGGSRWSAAPRRRHRSGSTPTAAPDSIDSGTDIRAVELTLDDAEALADQTQAPDVLGVAPVVNAVVGGRHVPRRLPHRRHHDRHHPSYLLDQQRHRRCRARVQRLRLPRPLPGRPGRGDRAPRTGRRRRQRASSSKTINLNGNAFTVIGILTAKGSTGPQDQDDRIIAPATAVQDTLAGYQNLSSISVKATSAATVDAAQAQVERILDARHGTTAADRGFSVTNSAVDSSSAVEHHHLDLHPAARRHRRHLAAGRRHRGDEHHAGHGHRAHPGDRHPQSHRRRQGRHHRPVPARGGDAVDVRRPARRAARARSPRLVKVGTFQPVVSAGSIVLAFCFALAVGLIFGLYPANRAASLKPIDALRYE